MQNRLVDIIIKGEYPCRDDISYLRQTVEQYPYCQPAWMLYAKALMEAGHPDFEQVVNRASAVVADRRRFREYLREEVKVVEDKTTEHSEKPGDSPGAKQPETSCVGQGDRNDATHAIIEKFLQSEPRISTIKDSIPAGEMSRQSIEDHPDIASETLAEILLQQGKIGRASEIYKKLSLKFPEKSSYFAKKLENIQKENN